MRLRACLLSLGLATVAVTQQPLVHAKPIATFALPGGAAMAAAFSPDGAALATGGELGDLVVLDIATRTERWHAWPSDHWIGTLAFSPDGTKLACLGRHLTMHDAATGARLWRIDDTGPHGFAWSADGEWFAYARGGEVCVRETTGDILVATHTFEYPVNTLCFGGDDLFAGDNVGRSWRMVGGTREPELLRTTRENESDMTRFLDVAWGGGALFELTSRGGLRRGDATFSLPGTPYELAVSRDGRSFAVGGEKATVRWWTQAGQEYEDHAVSGKVAALAFHPDGKTLFASTYDGDSLLLAAGKQPVVLPGHPDRISHTALSPDGSVVAMLGDHCVLQPVDGSPAHTLPGVLSVAAGRTGSEILVTTKGQCRVVDGRTGAEILVVHAQTDLRTRTVLGPGNRVLCGYDAKFTDLVTGERGALDLPEGIHLWSNWRESARAPDGSWAIVSVGGIEGEIGSLVVTDGAGTVRIAEDGGPMTTVAYSPDGRWLVHDRSDSNFVGGTNDRLVVRDGHTLAVLREIPRNVSSLRFLGPHRALIGDREGIAVLDVETGEVVQRLPELGTRRSFLLSADTHTMLCGTGREVEIYRLEH